ELGERGADAGDIIIAGTGRVVGAAGAGAGGDVVEVPRVLVQGRHDLLGAGAVQGRLTVAGASLVGDGQECRPLGGPGAGAADGQPAIAGPAVVVRVIDGEPGGRGRIIGDVGIGPLRRLRHDASLVRRLGHVGAGAAPAAAPAGLTRPDVVGTQRQGG